MELKKNTIRNAVYRDSAFLTDTLNYPCLRIQSQLKKIY